MHARVVFPRSKSAPSLSCCRAQPPTRVGVTLLFFIISVAVVALPGFGQSGGPEVHIAPRARLPEPSRNESASPLLKTQTKPLRVDVDLVLIPVTVADPRDRLITGLDKINFALYEGSTKEEIRYLSCEDAPVSVGVILDTSGSMSNKMGKAREAVLQFFRAANPQDEFFLIGFSNRPAVLFDFTASVQQIQERLDSLVPEHGTALRDAIYLGLNKMRQAKHPKKALLIISDGGDNHSRYTQGEIKAIVKEADVQVYAVGIFDAKPRTHEERMGPAILTEITDVTGGRTFTIHHPDELADATARIGSELRNQYLLGYRPSNRAHDGKWHRIKVRLNPPPGLPPLHVYARKGYYAPSN